MLSHGSHRPSQCLSDIVKTLHTQPPDLQANLRCRSDVVLEMWEQSPLKWDEENHAVLQEHFYTTINFRGSRRK